MAGDNLKRRVLGGKNFGRTKNQPRKVLNEPSPVTMKFKLTDRRGYIKTIQVTEFVKKRKVMVKSLREAIQGSEERIRSLKLTTSEGQIKVRKEAVLKAVEDQKTADLNELEKMIKDIGIFKGRLKSLNELKK